MTSPLDLVRRVALILNSLEIAHHFTGSIASSWHGQPRTTVDIDVVIDADLGRLDTLAEVLEPNFYVSREAIREAIEHRSSFNAISLDSPYKVDFFIVGNRPYDREAFRRSVEHFLGRADSPPVRLLSPEDTVLRKLEWYRLGGEVSDHQWRDVLGILVARCGSLDTAYLDSWAVELNIADLLKRVREQAADV